MVLTEDVASPEVRALGLPSYVGVFLWISGHLAVHSSV
jgi:hypothetical protein